MRYSGETDEIQRKHRGEIGRNRREMEHPRSPRGGARTPSDPEPPARAEIVRMPIGFAVPPPPSSETP